MYRAYLWPVRLTSIRVIDVELASFYLRVSYFFLLSDIIRPTLSFIVAITHFTLC